MPDPTERIHELETGVKLLQKDSQIQTRILEKLDARMEHVQDMSEAMSRIMIVHDEKFKAQDKQNTITDATIAERRTEAMREVKDLEQKLDDHEARMMTALKEMKEDLITRIDAVKTPLILPAPPKEKFQIVDWLVTNWKYIAFLVAFAGGIATHKWGVFTALFG